MIGTIASLFAAVSMTATMGTADIHTSDLEQWESIGEHRISVFCPVCNDGSGHESSSGKYLESGDCACSWLPIGTEVSIEGDKYTVVDICGMDDTIDIFVDDDSGECHCNYLDYKEVRVKK